MTAWLFSALLLGLVGSLHCAGMCGPLVLAVPAASGQGGFAGRLTYHGGRISVYVLLGAGLGMVGRSLSLVGLQQTLSVLSGVLVLLAGYVSFRPRGMAWLTRWLVLVRGLARIGSAPGGRVSQFAMGGVNGLLPCGLVYVAASASLVAGEWWKGAALMLTFGLGTLPMLLGLGLALRRLRGAWRERLQRLVPAAITAVGLLLVLRGLGLGIPLVSPKIRHAEVVCEDCVAGGAGISGVAGITAADGASPSSSGPAGR